MRNKLKVIHKSKNLGLYRNICAGFISVHFLPSPIRHFELHFRNWLNLADFTIALGGNYKKKC
jgi:hypothetical protein